MVERLRVGFLEPHLGRYGGIRRILELSNRLVERGHEVRIYVPDDERTVCDWMPCRAEVRQIPAGFEDELDVLVFNEESQWHLVPRFVNAGRRVMYVLHFAQLYGKAGAWESIRLPVDLQLANSAWTADMVEADTGHRPTVLLGGINPEHFRPLPGVRTRYPMLTMGSNRPWKGDAVIDAAAAELGLPVERYAGKDLDQSQMAAEYAAAEVFVVGSDHEGFCQPGLEALACGTPLVTTDNGGCREYAVHEQTALVVPPRDPSAMAAAIRRLRQDTELRERLRANGLALVRERFDWDAAAARLEDLLEGVVSGDGVEPNTGTAPTLRGKVRTPTVSCVVLQWEQLQHTMRCVQSLRQHTDVPYEVIVVDNGSSWQAANYAETAGDISVVNDRNTGFSHGMNQGLERARGRIVAFCNNDTVFPAGWASRLVGSLEGHPDAAMVVPAVTSAGNPRTVRTEPGDTVEVLAPFEAPPSAVVYVARKEVVAALGGWNEREYPVASGEDLDLCFTVWANDLDIVYDTRVVVEHVGKGSAQALDDWRALWDANRDRFLAKWTSRDPAVPRLATVEEDRFRRNVATARGVAEWMQRFYAARADLDDPRRASLVLAHQAVRSAREIVPAPVRRSVKHGLKQLWLTLAAILPAGTRERVEDRLRLLFRSGR